ncbi:ATP-binding protein [Actinoplanes sp. NPDC051343]|uniref:ATP-binding protein n=1 Tax=Actinoplanes sp. NPDC051343 TaxID=3363906 RepID=UPI00378FC20D
MSLAHGFTHTIALIQSDATVRTRLLPEIRRSLERRQPVLMVVSETIADLVRADLGTLADRLQWGDATAFYGRLGAAYEGFRRYLAERHAAGHRVHVIAEPELADSVASGPVAHRTCAYLPYESMCNEAYAPYESPVTCVWDTRRHPPSIIEEARSVHGHELTEAGRVGNPGYRAPDDYLTGRGHATLPPVPGEVDHDVTLHQLDDLSVLRRTVAAWTRDHDFRPAAADDVSIAVTEIATNALLYGGRPARARGWHDDGTLIVQVDDPGGRPPPPTAGYRPPAATSATNGRGLWLARQLADTVTIHTSPGRTYVRLHFPHQIMHRSVD